MSKAKKTRNAHRARAQAPVEPPRSLQRATPGRPMWIRVTVGVIALALVGALITLPFIGGGSDDEPDQVTPTSVVTSRPFEYGTTACPPPDGIDEPVLRFEDPPQLCLDLERSYVAVLDTSRGEVRIALDTERTPGTANNFATLARYGYYDDTELFRTNTGLSIIQGGSPTTQDPSDPGPGYRLQDEGGDFVLSDLGSYTGPFTYAEGQIVMARSAGPDGAGAQFFLATGPEVDQLSDPRRADAGSFVAFGTADSAGLDVLRDIIALHVGIDSSPDEGAPSETVTINTITIEEA